MLSLDPRTLSEVADSVRILARAVDRVDRGEEIVAEMWSTIDAAADAVRGLPRKRVFFAEWIEPPFSAGHWLPEMIELAGGSDVLGHAGQPFRPVTWDAVAAAEPELIVIAPCGFDADAAAARVEGIPLPCPAVAVDADSYYSRPAPRLAAGVAQLAHLLHPESATDPGLPAIPLGVEHPTFGQVRQDAHAGRVVR
jgi:iron complex transport system substrate-binding protein